MSDRYSDICEDLRTRPRRWLVTGAAGFIGSNLVEKLLELGQEVVGLDNFSTGYRRNLDEVGSLVGKPGTDRFTFIEGDICDLEACRAAVEGCSHVLHQAALGSVPRSLDNPIRTNDVNVGGFLNMLVAARDAGVEHFVYAASSSTYGDHPALPKVEDRIGKPLSPYAVTKYVNELYAEVFARSYGFQSIGLRYFNVFGPRQDPQGAYAAVIPTWTAAMLTDSEIFINGDGETSRDFCYVANAVQANILAASAEAASLDQVYNIAVGERTTLNQLFDEIGNALSALQIKVERRPSYRDFRAGDVRHSQADVSKARELIGYSPSHTVRQGLAAAMPWYRDFFQAGAK